MQLIEYNAGLLATCMAVLLGFVDDVLDLKWRHKLIVPTIATLPLLVAYNGVTNVIMPKFLRPIVGPFVNLGILYHMYMGTLAVFCTNSINIYAGINGIEAGQSFIIACFILIHNIIVREFLNIKHLLGDLSWHIPRDSFTSYFLSDNNSSLHLCNLESIETQLIPFESIRRGHFLLLCGHDFCYGWNLGTLHKNHAVILPSPDFQLLDIVAINIWHHSLPETQITKVQ